jgi:hypothetical protein
MLCARRAVPVLQNAALLTWLSYRLPTAGTGYTYISANNVTYALNTNPADWPTAESACNDMGGHLAYYASQAEQVHSPPSIALCICQAFMALSAPTPNSRSTMLQNTQCNTLSPMQRARLLRQHDSHV